MTIHFIGAGPGAADLITVRGLTIIKRCKVVLYADKTTDSISNAVKETNRRRELQISYNKKHKITPATIVKPVKEKTIDVKDTKHVPKREIPNVVIELEAEMRRAAEQLDFERAIALRERIKKLNERLGSD